MMKRLVFLFFFALLCSGCSSDAEDPQPADEIVCKPRSVEHLWIVPDTPEQTTSAFMLRIHTSNLPLSSRESLFALPPYLRHNPDVLSQGDEALEALYRASAYAAMRDFYGILPSTIEYRTSAVEDLTITANCKILDREAGESLNDLFRIISGAPACLVSSEGFDYLAFGAKFEQYPELLSDWLAFRPFAPATLTLKLKPGLRLTGLNGRFAVELTTTDGKRLTAETEPVTFK